MIKYYHLQGGQHTKGFNSSRAFINIIAILINSDPLTFTVPRHIQLAQVSKVWWNLFCFYLNEINGKDRRETSSSWRDIIPRNVCGSVDKSWFYCVFHFMINALLSLFTRQHYARLFSWFHPDTNQIQMIQMCVHYSDLWEQIWQIASENMLVWAVSCVSAPP